MDDAPSLRESDSALFERFTAAPDVYVAIGEWVRQERERHGLNQTELGNRLGLGRTSVTNLEAGRQRILAHVLIDLVRFFKQPAGAIPRPTVKSVDYRDACDCPAGWVTCSRNPCARAERIIQGIRQYTAAEIERVRKDGSSQQTPIVPSDRGGRG